MPILFLWFTFQNQICGKFENYIFETLLINPFTRSRLMPRLVNIKPSLSHQPQSIKMLSKNRSLQNILDIQSLKNIQSAIGNCVTFLLKAHSTHCIKFWFNQFYLCSTLVYSSQHKNTDINSFILIISF